MKFRIFAKFRQPRSRYYGDSIGPTPYIFTFSESAEFSTFTDKVSRRLGVFSPLRSHVNENVLRIKRRRHFVFFMAQVESFLKGSWTFPRSSDT